MAARRVSAAEYAAQRDRTTAEQLNLLAADPAFKAWEERKATRGRLAAAAANTALAAACVLLVLALALLRPTAPHQVRAGAIDRRRASGALSAAAPLHPHLAPPNSPPARRSPHPQSLPISEAAPAPTSIPAIPTDAAPAASWAVCEPGEAAEQLEALRRQLDAARQETEAATAALADRDLQLRSERAARADAHDSKQLGAKNQQLRTDNEQLRTENQQLRTDLAQLPTNHEQLRTENQRLAAANQQLTAANKQLEAANHQLTAANKQLETDKQRLAAAAAAAASLTEATAGVAMAALGDVLPTAPAALSALLPPRLAATLAGPAATAYALLAALAIAALALMLQLRGRRAAAAQAAHAAALAARLKETAFARDTAEKSLELLEGELQHRMKQLEDAQQRAADAGGLGQGALGGRGWLPCRHATSSYALRHRAALHSLSPHSRALPAPPPATCSISKDRHRPTAPACPYPRQGRAAAAPRQPGGEVPGRPQLPGGAAGPDAGGHLDAQ